MNLTRSRRDLARLRNAIKVDDSYAGMRGKNRGIKVVDFGSADVTVGNHPLVGTTSTVAKSGGKATITAPASMAAGSSYGCYATPLVTDWSDGDMVYLDIDFPVDGNTMVFYLVLYDATFVARNATAIVEVAGVAKPRRMVLAVPKGEFTLTGWTAADWANVGQVGVFAAKVAATPVNVTESFDVYAVWTGTKTRAAVVLAFDDTNANLPELLNGTNNGGLGMIAYGIPLTLYAIPSQWGLGGSATVAQVAQGYAAGWDVAIHGVTAAVHLLSITWAAGVATATSLIANHGFATSDVVPIYGADPYALNGNKTITVTGATTFTYATAQSGSGSALGTITCPKKEGGTIGQTDTQAAIFANERALALAAGFSRGNDHFAYPNGAYTEVLDARLASMGFKTRRTTARVNDVTLPTKLSGANSAQPSINTTFTGIGTISGPISVIELNESSPVSLAHVLAIIDLAIKYGGLVVVYGHSIVPSTSVPNLEWLTTKWWPLVKALKVRRDNKLVDLLTISQAWDAVREGAST